MTTEAAKLSARKLAWELTKELKPFGVTEAKVNDWGSYNNFSILVFLDVQESHTKNSAFRPKDSKTFNLHKIVAGIKRVCRKQGVVFVGIDRPPLRVYTTSHVMGYCEKWFDGYDKDYIYLAVDIHNATVEEGESRPGNVE